MESARTVCTWAQDERPADLHMARYYMYCNDTMLMCDVTCNKLHKEANIYSHPDNLKLLKRQAKLKTL
jgi:hypothetical protein